MPTNKHTDTLTVGASVYIASSGEAESHH